MAAKPVIQTSSPGAFSVHGPGSISTSRVLILKGTDMAPAGTTGWDVNARVKVFMRTTGAWQPAIQTAWSFGVAQVEFPTKPWLEQAGGVEFKVVCDGVSSDPFSVPVWAAPTTPPMIKSANPSKFIVGKQQGPWAYLVRVSAANLADAELLTITIGGWNAAIGWMDLGDGVLDIWFPKEIREKQGNYELKIGTTSGGMSAPALIEVVRRPFIGPKEATTRSRVEGAGLRGRRRDLLAWNAILQRSTDVSARHQADATAIAQIDPRILVGVKPVNGISVTLTGHVATAAARATAEKEARKIPGVRWVTNELVVE